MAVPNPLHTEFAIRIGELCTTSSELLSLHAFSQTGHMKFEVLVWVVMWALRVDLLPKVLGQLGQLKFLSPV